MRPSQSTDKDKIADALRQDRHLLAKEPILADWPSNPKNPKAEYRILHDLRVSGPVCWED
jgi:hypothetical protein